MFHTCSCTHWKTCSRLYLIISKMRCCDRPNQSIFFGQPQKPHGCHNYSSSSSPRLHVQCSNAHRSFLIARREVSCIVMCVKHITECMNQCAQWNRTSPYICIFILFIFINMFCSAIHLFALGCFRCTHLFYIVFDDNCDDDDDDGGSGSVFVVAVVVVEILEIAI